MGNQKKILVCPLEWGIGHATRVVPVVRELKRQGAEVHLGASGGCRAFLEEELPDLEMHEFPGHEVTYPSSGPGMTWKIVKQLPWLLRSVRAEHRFLDDLITRHGFTGVISDNRYGAFSERVPSVLITHQVFIQMPPGLSALQGTIDRRLKRYIDRFDACWIPDNAGRDNLSGDLSHRDPLPSRCHFIGPLSRFSHYLDDPSSRSGSGENDILAILSGPEPQRSLLEGRLLDEFSSLGLDATLVRGKPGETAGPVDHDHCTVYNHLSSRELGRRMRGAGIIICRPGYSTLMDLATLGCHALLVPTPGQTEQEYLARYHGRKGNYLVSDQGSLTLDGVAEAIRNYPGLQVASDGAALQERVAHFLECIK